MGQQGRTREPSGLEKFLFYLGALFVASLFFIAAQHSLSTIFKG